MHGAIFIHNENIFAFERRAGRQGSGNFYGHGFLSISVVERKQSRPPFAKAILVTESLLKTIGLDTTDELRLLDQLNFYEFSACSRSQRISSISSRPMDRRIKSGLTPAAFCSSSVSWEWVVLAG